MPFQRPPDPPEAWILALHRGCERVELRLLTADGRFAPRARAREDADWLELAAGQIVALSDPLIG
jgi:hypothetical protein